MAVSRDAPSRLRTPASSPTNAYEKRACIRTRDRSQRHPIASPVLS